jgi:iron complex outermembrane recepter protein
MNRVGQRRRSARFKCWLLTSVSAASIFSVGSVARAQEATPIPDVSVTAPAAQSATSTSQPTEGSVAAGYRPSTISNVGPLGTMKIEDVPYSVNVMSAPLIENTFTSSQTDLYKINPEIQALSTTTRSASANPLLRGFSVGNGSGTAEDGLRIQNMYSEPLEDKERVETYTGLTSFLYGVNNVGGLINYAYKRPTADPYASVTLGDYGGLAGYAKGDFSGPIDKDSHVYYRLNIVGLDGQTAVDNQKEKRDLITGAVSWQPSGDFNFTVIGSHYDQVFNGIEPSWNFATNPNGSSKIFHSAPPDPTENFGQPFSSYAFSRDRIGADMTWKIDDIFTLRSAFATSYGILSDDTYVNNNVNTNNGTYTQQFFHLNGFDYLANSGYTFLDAEFNTGPIKHKVTTGFYANDFTQSQAPTSYASINSATYPLSVTPTYLSAPNFAASNFGPVTRSSYNNNSNFIIGDDIKFTDQWSALVGADYAVLTGENYSTTTGQQTSGYDQAKLSPSASIIYKPLEWLSTYATYSESLQGGTPVTSSGSMVFTNAGQILNPYVGQAYETGVKAKLGGTLVTLAFYDITQALQYNQYNNNGTYTAVQNGMQNDKGVELNAVGNVTDGFRLFGGITYIDARITESASSPTVPSLDGYRPPGVANFMAKVTAEYDLRFVPGLTLTGGVYYTGKQAVDTLNTEYLPAYVTADVGLRYKTKLTPGGNDFIFRFDVKNVANEAYWITPSYVGQPRTFAFSAQTIF